MAIGTPSKSGGDSDEIPVPSIPSSQKRIIAVPTGGGAEQKEGESMQEISRATFDTAMDAITNHTNEILDGIRQKFSPHTRELIIAQMKLLFGTQVLRNYIKYNPELEMMSIDLGALKDNILIMCEKAEDVVRDEARKVLDEYGLNGSVPSRNEVYKKLAPKLAHIALEGMSAEEGKLVVDIDKLHNDIVGVVDPIVQRVRQALQPDGEEGASTPDQGQ